MQLIYIIASLWFSALVASAPHDAADGVIARDGHSPGGPSTCASNIDAADLDELATDYNNYMSFLGLQYNSTGSSTSPNYGGVFDAPDGKVLCDKLNATVSRLENKYGNPGHKGLQARGIICNVCLTSCLPLLAIPFVGPTLNAICRAGCLLPCLTGR